MKDIIDKEDFVVMYKPLINREESIRLGASQETAEAAYATAVKSGASRNVLKQIAMTTILT